VVPLVEGIENFQAEYGVGGVFTAEPGTIADWRGVTAVKLHLLARNLAPTRGHHDAKSYTLGRNSDGNEYVVEAPGDEYKRHVFQSQVVLRNPAGRMTPK
jgi:hypothetical protein